MTVYFGNDGMLELKRASATPIQATVGVGDVSVERRRFSFSEDIQGELISGDQVDIVLVPKGNLDFIVGHNSRDWRGYVFIDIMGGIRLYDDFNDSIAGEVNNALELKVPSTAQEIAIQTRSSRYSPLARLRSYEFTTERETVDTTTLTDEFRKRFEAGLISGQGRLDCLWDHANEMCDPTGCSGAELPIYLAQLCIRLVQGADFFGRFYIYSPCTDDPRAGENSVWYEAECIVTNVSVTVPSGSAIESSIDFVTTGPFKLLIGEPPSYLLTEEPAKLLQEDGSGIFLSPLD